jgi:hypothetical protein
MYSVRPWQQRDLVPPAPIAGDVDTQDIVQRLNPHGFSPCGSHIHMSSAIKHTNYISDMNDILLRHRPLRSRRNSESTKRYCAAIRARSSSILLHTYVFVKYYYFCFNENDNACLILERGYWSCLQTQGLVHYLARLSPSWVNCLSDLGTSQ